MSPRDARRARALDRLKARTGAGLTGHAAMRLAEHGFSMDEVLLAVAAPEQTYGSPARYGPDRRTYQRGRVAVVVDERNRLVITVLPRVQQRWEHKGAEGRARSASRHLHAASVSGLAVQDVPA